MSEASIRNVEVPYEFKMKGISHFNVELTFSERSSDEGPIVRFVRAPGLLVASCFVAQSLTMVGGYIQISSQGRGSLDDAAAAAVPVRYTIVRVYGRPGAC